MALPVIAVSAAVAASAGVASGVMNYEASQRAKSAQDALRDQQASELRKQKEAADNLAAQQAITGQTFGGERARATADGLGFGSGGSSTNTGFGRSQLTGTGA